jgi:hypothetical protein
MKKGELKHTNHFSPNTKPSPNSPSASKDSSSHQSGAQNIFVLKKYKLDHLNNPNDIKENSPSLSRSLKTPLTSNLVTNNLLQSIKSKKLNQTDNNQPNDDKCISSLT